PAANRPTTERRILRRNEQLVIPPRTLHTGHLVVLRRPPPDPGVVPEQGPLMQSDNGTVLFHSPHHRLNHQILLDRHRSVKLIRQRIRKPPPLQDGGGLLHPPPIM